jgi:hypothetical protein
MNITHSLYRKYIHTLSIFSAGGRRGGVEAPWLVLRHCSVLQKEYADIGMIYRWVLHDRKKSKNIYQAQHQTFHEYMANT